MNKFFTKILFLLFFSFHLSVFASPARKNLVIVLDWFINPNHAPLFVAQQEGFFEQNGLQVKFISLADTVSGEKMVASGRADIVITYESSLLLHLSQGLPLVHFANLIDKPLDCLVTLKDENIFSLKDLKGKRIGYSGTEVERIVMATMLKTVKLSLNDVCMINVKFNLISALLSKKIDAFIGGMRNFEPLALELNGKKARVFYPEKYGVPKHSALIVVTNRNKIHDQSLARFVFALKMGVEYLKKNPEKSWHKFIANHPELNNDLNYKSWFLTIPYFSNNPAKINSSR